jgi:hypothetical protein
VAKRRARRNYKPHELNSSVLVINNETQAEGVDMIEAERNSDETTIVTSADGLSLPSINPDQSGTIKLTVLEASATTDVLWDLYNAGDPFSVGVSDDVSPKFDVKGQNCYITKAPIVRRGPDADRVEWTFVCGYLDIRGGSYDLLSP